MINEQSQYIVEAIDSEVAFYRRRAGQVFLLGLTVEVLILAGRERIVVPLTRLWIPPLAYGVLFLAVAAVGILLGREYRDRIHHLKVARRELAAFDPPRGGLILSEIEVLYVVLVFLSSCGVILVWLNAITANEGKEWRVGGELTVTFRFLFVGFMFLGSTGNLWACWKVVRWSAKAWRRTRHAADSARTGGSAAGLTPEFDAQRAQMALERTAVIKELAGATSAQSQIANRYWIALITVSLLAALPRQQGADMPLPFGLGPIEPSSFYLAMFGLLVVLTIAFASAHAQLMRVQRLAYRGMDQLGDEPVLEVGIHPRDLFDALRLPSVVRLAPLAQLFRGRDSFFGSPGNVPPWRKWAAAVYYMLLKAASWLVYFGFPGMALWLTLVRIQASGAFWYLLLAAASIATFSLCHVLIVDIGYVLDVKSVIVESRVPNSGLQPTAVDASGDRRS